MDEYLKETGEIVRRKVPNAEIYIYGSVIEGDYSVGLSDIDVAIVSDVFKNREKKLEIFGKLSRIFMDSPFEFHVLTREQWNFYKNFVKKFRKV